MSAMKPAFEALIITHDAGEHPRSTSGKAYAPSSPVIVPDRALPLSRRIRTEAPLTGIPAVETMPVSGRTVRGGPGVGVMTPGLGFGVGCGA